VIGLVYAFNKNKKPEAVQPVKPSSIPGNRSPQAGSSSAPLPSSVKSSLITINKSLYQEQYKDHRKVIAPAGRLGIVIEKTANGPLIKRVNDTSPLVGQLYAGDKLVEIDGQSTDGMTSEAITSYMSQNADRERAFLVSSPMNNIRNVSAPSGPLGKLRIVTMGRRKKAITRTTIQSSRGHDSVMVWFPHV
jgi:hypothetical protein